MKSLPPARSASFPHRARTPWGALHRQLVVLVLALAGLACGEASSDTTVAAAEQPLVEVFVTDWCPYCQRLEAFLKQNRIAYQRKNIEQSAQFRAEHEELGGGGIPVTRIGGRQVIRGFRPDAIADAIGLKDRPTGPSST